MEYVFGSILLALALFCILILRILKSSITIENVYGARLTKLHECSTDWLKCSDLLSQVGSKLHAMAIPHVTRLNLHSRRRKKISSSIKSKHFAKRLKNYFII